MGTKVNPFAPALRVPEEAPLPSGISHVDDPYGGWVIGDRVFDGQFKETEAPKPTKVVTKTVFRRMHEYSLSAPTQPSVGRYYKRWQRGLGWLYAEVVACEDKPGWRRTVWSKLRVIADDVVPVRRRGISIRHESRLIDVEYSGDTVLILEGGHAGTEAILMGPDGDGWRVLVNGALEVHVGADALEVL